MSNKRNKEILKKLEFEVEQAKKSEDIFWKETYPKMNKKDKIKFWASSLNRSMRFQEESGFSAYSIYNTNWLKDVLKSEPDFFELLSGIFSIWSGTWDTLKIERILKNKHKKMKGNSI
ncbi:hypothetical protein [Tenacibaculum sp. SDUM215027]|uniref:hypothetical protein n=1 Tax=Tenacibaculum sp. SDUM215027 TaxID=3422596 RepID=UPI003D31B3D8